MPEAEAAPRGHALVATFHHDRVSLDVVCHEPLDALCRNSPDCGCESYSGIEKDEQGWFHAAWNDDFDRNGPQDDTNREEVEHRHTISTTCNYREWMDNTEIEECGPAAKVELGRIAVDFKWEGDYYTWQPAAAEPKPVDRHATTCDLLVGRGRRVCSCRPVGDPGAVVDVDPYLRGIDA